MYYDLTIVYQDTLFIIDTDYGFTYSMPTNLKGETKYIGKLGELPTRQVFPAPVLKQIDFKCE